VLNLRTHKDVNCGRRP